MEKESKQSPIVEDLAFKGNDPGAVQYGNFINYYQFHSPKNRLENLTKEMFSETEDICVCLDIGCNTGNLTRELYTYMEFLFPQKEIYILGIDIDPLLVERASEKPHKNITFKNIDIMDKSSMKVLREFLKIHNKELFDVIFCFSVTMWIHLNHGDDGLKQFLDIVKNNTFSVIVEPQPWRCYKTACKRMRKSNSHFPLFKTLQIKENIEETIEKLITEKNFCKTAESAPSAWNRKVQSFHRIK